MVRILAWQTGGSVVRILAWQTGGSVVRILAWQTAGSNPVQGNFFSDFLECFSLSFTCMYLYNHVY